MGKDEQRLFNERGERLESYRNRIRELEAELAEARLDSARLDWLERNNVTPMPIESEMIKAVGGYRVRGQRFNSLRAAIDAAMKEAK